MLKCFVLASIFSIALCDFNFFRKAATFPLDDNSRLRDHWLVHTNNKECKDFTETLWNARSDNKFRKVASIDSPVSEQVFGNFSKNDTKECRLACLDRGASLDYFTNVLPEKIFVYHESTENVMDWFHTNCQAVEVGFISYFDFPLAMFWLDTATGNSLSMGRITQGEHAIMWQRTTLGHVFEARNEATNEALGLFTVEHYGVFVLGGTGPTQVTSMNATRNIQTSLNSEFSRAKNVKRTFTELGFSRSRLPDDLWASMSAYYYNNRNNFVREEWNRGKGLFVNWWEKDVYMLNMPFQLKVIDCLFSLLCLAERDCFMLCIVVYCYVLLYFF